jgi:hypothetical protein
MTLQAREINAKNDDTVRLARVLYVEDAPQDFVFWMADEARRMLQLGAFFYGMSILCQIPGAARHKFLFWGDDDTPGVPVEDDDPRYWVGKDQPHVALDVLAECLRRLGTLHLMQQIPGAAKHQPDPLTQEYCDWLDRHARAQDGLLNLVAYCLDVLILHPAEEEANRLPQRWHDWWKTRFSADSGAERRKEVTTTGILLEGEPAAAAGVQAERLTKPPQAGVEGEPALPVKTCENLDQMLAALRRNPELQAQRLRQHLEQSQAAAAQHHWHAAVNEARLLLDTLFLTMGCAAQQAVLRGAGKVPDHTPGPRLCRRYLLVARLLGNNDLELLTHVMSITSTWQGSADGAWCDVMRRIIWTTARYLLLRYEAWKRAAATAGV